MKKLLIIISTGEADKAVTAMMYATNCLANQWMEEVKLFIFGPAENLLVNHQQFREMVQDFLDMNQQVVACRALADEQGISDHLAKQGVTVDYVGAKISDLIHQGYVPMVW